jgi:hypothetical protein
LKMYTVHYSAQYLIGNLELSSIVQFIRCRVLHTPTYNKIYTTKTYMFSHTDDTLFSIYIQK